MVPQIVNTSDVTMGKQFSDLVKRTGNNRQSKIDSRIMFLCVLRQRKLTYSSKVACNTPATAQEPVERSIDPCRQQIHQNAQSPQSARKVSFPTLDTISVPQFYMSDGTGNCTMFEPDSASPSDPE